MNGLKVQDFHGKQVIDSRDVAQMVERDHKELMIGASLFWAVIYVLSMKKSEREIPPSPK